jgi:hypothetical protein
MPQLDASTAPALPDLGSVLTSWLEHADLCEVLRKRAQVRRLSGQAGLPRRGASEAAARWLSGVHAVAEFASRERFGARAFYLALPTDQAAGLFDRVLGGGGQAGIPARSGALSDAECGVLAHLAAHACAACSDTLAVRDVFCADAPALRALCAAGALWPLRIAAEGLALDVKIIFAAPAECPAGRYPFAVSVRDELPHEILAALTIGDLLASDAWPLSVSTRGLEGRVELSVFGLSERVEAVLSGRRITSMDRPSPPPDRTRAELRLAELALDFWALAALGSGAPVELPEESLREATLHVDGLARAAGSLAQLRGVVALRVHSLFTRDSTL